MKKGIINLIIFLVLMTSLVSAAFDYGSTQATLLNQDPDPAEPGKYVEVRWKVIKSGNEVLKDITYTLELDYPFSLIPGDTATRNIGNWGGSPDTEEYAILYYKLKVADDALEDTYPVKLKYSTGGSTSGVTYEHDIRVGEKVESQFVLGTLVTSPAQLVADIDEAEFQFEIENIGDGNAEHVKTELILPKGFDATYSYSNKKNIGTIQGGEGKTATYYVDIFETMTGGLYDSAIIIQYKDEGESEYKNITLPIQIQIKDQPKFEIISATTYPEKTFPGMPTELRFVIKNTGGEEAESVSLRAFKESTQPFDFTEKSDYIGKLLPGEMGDAVLKLDIDETATTKNYIIDLEIRAIDDQEVLIKEKSTTLEIVAPSQTDLEVLREARKQTNIAVQLILPIVILTIGFFTGKYFGKRKKVKGKK